MQSLNGRVALVTGAAQGIGKACSLVLAQDGATVAMADIQEANLQAAAAEITAGGGKAVAYKMDVSSEDDIKAVLKRIIAEQGKVDILVNNAGITRDQLVMRMKRGDWDAVLNIDLTAPFLLIQAAISSMLKQRWGRIINISSVIGRMGQVGQANYASAKAGLIGLTMAVAREVASRNITVNCVAPGFIESAMTAAMAPEMRESLLKMVPMQRAGQGMDVAQAVRFFASEEASYITGDVLNVNGGMLMG
jgi:3-oxoacyl-[acyl-carrier protein] reductase